MNREKLEENWGEIADKLMNRFPKLTTIDVVFVKGHEEELLTRIESRLDKTRLQVLALISTL